MVGRSENTCRACFLATLTRNGDHFNQKQKGMVVVVVEGGGGADAGGGRAGGGLCMNLSCANHGRSTRKATQNRGFRKKN